MSVPRPHDSSYDLTVQPTVSALHIPVSHAFIPFQQFSITDASRLRNPADDNNNKTVPVVSVVTAVSGLCPTIPVVSMQQTTNLAQAVVAPTIIPGVVTPMTVHTANCLAPTTTMTVSKTLNISSHISVPIQQQKQQQTVNIPTMTPQTVGIPTMTPQTVGISAMTPQTSSVNMNPINLNNSHQITASTIPGNKSANTATGISSSPPSNNSNNTVSGKSSSKTAPSNVSSEQNEDLVKPVFKDGELVLEVECGQNKALLYLSKLCQGSKGPCISFQSSWLTPNEFQFVSGRETAKDWKRSIRHHGKSLKLLLAKGILNVHPTMCDCDGCRQGATLTRKGEKRRIPNGERKPRKPTSSSGTTGSDGNSTGSFRPVGSSTMAVHSASPGAPQTKPEVRRSAVDKPKMEDTTPSLLPEGSGKLFANPPLIQRPNTLNTSKDNNKQASPTTTTILPAPPSGTTSISSTSLVHLNSSGVSFTAGQGQPFSTAAAQSSSPAAITQLAPLSPHGLLIPPTAAASISASSPDQHVGRPSSSSSLASHVQSPIFTSINPAHIPNLPMENHHLLDSAADNSDEHSKPDMSDDDDNQFDDDTDGSQNADDDLDDESDDDESEKSSKDSEINDSMSDDDQIIDEISHKTNTNDTTCITNSPGQQCEIKCVDNSRECNDAEKDIVDFSRPVDPEKLSGFSAADVSSEDNHDFVSQPATPPLASVAALAVSAFPGTCSQPLCVAISGTNVRSEHIWVPPRLSPQGEAPHIHRVHNGSSRGKSPTDTAYTEHNHFKVDHTTTFAQIKDSDKAVSRKTERPSQAKEQDHAGPRPDNISGATATKDFQSIERHLTRNYESERSGIKCEPGQVKSAQTVNTASNEKNIREREREERHRQRVREERNRREREERNRKDREREERREYERREEKDTEKRRQEEKERREIAKSQSETSASMDQSAVATLMDPCRRPTGGVAEAAAFSDYMRMLAAGHGHTFISPALSYMPSILPFRPQEASIPALMHPMSAFGHQLGGLPKDHMLYQTAGGVLSNYGTPPFGPVHPLLQRPQYTTTQQSLLDYQRSLTAASSYSWPTAYPYFLHDITAASSSASSSASATATLAAGAKRPSSEIEAAMEMSSKRMRLDSRPAAEYSSPWDYFAAAASQHQRGPAMAPSLPCGLESANMDKTAEYLRKRYMEYGPQTAAYLSAFPEYIRSPYHCACADHRDDNIHMWGVDDVCKFLHSLEGCAVYSEHFREQRVTGRILALLTSDHLVKTMGMKLGPAVQLAEAVARKLQDSNKISSCEACRNIALSQPFHPMALPL